MSYSVTLQPVHEEHVCSYFNSRYKGTIEEQMQLVHVHGVRYKTNFLWPNVYIPLGAITINRNLLNAGIVRHDDKISCFQLRRLLFEWQPASGPKKYLEFELTQEQGLFLTGQFELMELDRSDDHVGF